MEEYIGRELNAVPNGDFFTFDYLELQTNGVVSAFAHHGPGAGEGANEGNGLRNKLRNYWIDALKDGRRCADIFYFGHVHVPTYNTYVARNKMDYKVVHGVITPALQLKTRYAYMVSPIEKNKIGGITMEIKADGTIGVPKFYIME